MRLRFADGMGRCVVARLPRALHPAAGTLLRWSPRLAASVADQALFSGAHFLCHVILARSATPAGYGAFSLAYAGFLFAATVHGALILEPVGVVGPLHYAGREKAYLRGVLALHWFTCAALGALMLGAAVLLGVKGSTAWTSMAAASFAAPAILLLWLVRRAAYMVTKPMAAVRTSALYALGLGVGLWLCHGIFDALVGPAALALMGAVAMAVCWPAFKSWSAREADAPDSGHRQFVRVIAWRHWEYGRWMLLRALLAWAASAAYLPLVAAMSGLQAAGLYRAGENLMLPIAQILTALGALWAPWMAAQHGTQQRGYLARAGAKASFAAGVLAGAYGVCLLAAGPRLSRWVYGGDDYHPALSLLPYFGVAYVLRGVSDTGLGSALRAAQRPDLLVRPAAVSAAATLTLGAWLAWRFPLVGAAAGLAASAAAGAVTTAVAFRACMAGQSSSTHGNRMVVLESRVLGSD